jgi:pyruvate-ferredoxin/flavodoxin oxidoreductase
MFFGLGSDGTVGANKASVKIIGESTDLFAQGYFVYDSKKSGSITVSHLRFGPSRSARPTSSRRRLRRLPPVRAARQDQGPRTRQARGHVPAQRAVRTGRGLGSPARRRAALLIDKDIDFWVIDALAVADEAGMGSRINTVMQPCFFQLPASCPPDEAIARSRNSSRRPTPSAATRSSPATSPPSTGPGPPRARDARPVTNDRRTIPAVADGVPDFVARITSRLLAGDGDLLPVSALPVDGTFPTGTTKYEKRAIAQMIPIWDPRSASTAASARWSARTPRSG